MPIETDLSTSPYFDDYKANNDYYKILFKPGVPVQTRELNQLQTMLQSQVEKFGDVIFKQGTIVDGCAFTFHDKLKYVKIKDNDVTGGPVTMTTYKNKFVKNSSNLVAQIIDTSTGFESQAPDLNTYTHLKYYSINRIEDAGAYTNQADVAYRFLPCMCAGLAYYLAMKKAPSLVQRNKLIYEDELKRALDEDGQRASTFIAPQTFYPTVS